MREGQGSHRQTPQNWEVPGLQRSPSLQQYCWTACRRLPAGHRQPRAHPGQFIEGGLSYLWSRKSCVRDSIARNLLRTVLARKMGSYRPQGSRLAAEERAVVWGCCSPGQVRGPEPLQCMLSCPLSQVAAPISSAALGRDKAFMSHYVQGSGERAQE